jgi:hypothetical protein
MRRNASIAKIGCLIAAVLATASCSIRLPGPRPAEIQRAPVSSATQPAKPKTQSPAHDPHVIVWLLSDNLHTGMVFPYDWLLESGFIPPKNFGTPRFVTMSWGDRTAYIQKAWLSPTQVFQALFTPTPSVMELIPINWDVTGVCPHQRISRKLVRREYGPQLAAFLNHCSRHDQNGRPIVAGPSSWGNGVLLESRHSYFFPRICNIWTLQAMEACGNKHHPWFAIAANGVIRQAESPKNGFEKIWDGGGIPTRKWSDSP